jgi:hypothetical protein
VGLVASACIELPEIKYRTERLAIGPDFDHPICEGTLRDLDEHVDAVEGQIGPSQVSEGTIFVYWLTSGVDEWCANSDLGCFFPGTRMLVTRAESLRHELVHAVIGANGGNRFVEEGIAELFSGVGAYSKTRPDLSDSLHLTEREYRRGGLGYIEAAHFAHYVFDGMGTSLVADLVADVRSDASPGVLEDTLEDAFERPLDGIEAEYEDHADNYYWGLANRTIDRVELEDLRAGIRRVLDCSNPETRGPLWDDSEGMYRVIRVWIPGPMEVFFEVEGDAGAWLQVVDPHEGDWRRVMPDWTRPDPKSDPGTVRIDTGHETTVSLRRGTHLLVFASTDTGRAVVQVAAERLCDGLRARFAAGVLIASCSRPAGDGGWASVCSGRRVVARSALA